MLLLLLAKAQKPGGHPKKRGERPALHDSTHTHKQFSLTALAKVGKVALRTDSLGEAKIASIRMVAFPQDVGVAKTVCKLVFLGRLFARLPASERARRAASRRGLSVLCPSGHTVPTDSAPPLQSVSRRGGRDRLEKRGLSQSLIQPIPADLRAQIRTEEEEEEKEGEGRPTRTRGAAAAAAWFVVSFEMPSIVIRASFTLLARNGPRSTI